MNGPGERLEILQGSFYAAIYRLEHRGPDQRPIERDAQYRNQRLFSVLFGVFSAMALALAQSVV